MDRYDRIIRDIQQKTDEEIIRWAAVTAGRYSEVLLNPSRVIRAFSAAYPVGQKTYELLFVERRVDFHNEFDYTTEVYGFELLVLDHNREIVLSLRDGVVERDDLLRLSGLIDAHNDRVKEFFGAFEESEAT